MRMGHKKSWHNAAYCLAMAGLMVIFIGSGGLLLKNLTESRKHEEDFEKLSAMFKEDRAQAEEQLMPEVIYEQEGEDAGRFAVYQSLKEQNEDMVGWIRIDGTRIDYPVVQTPDRPDYYLHRDFNKEKSSYGIPYMAEQCSYENPGTNLLIYGHHMKNGGMFADLQNYTEEAFYRQHPYIRFDTVDRPGKYEVVAVVRVDASSDVTPWQKLLFPRDEVEFGEAWKIFGQQSFYHASAAPEYEDRLLALVTCEYTLEDGRLMVVSKEIR